MIYILLFLIFILTFRISNELTSFTLIKNAIIFMASTLIISEVLSFFHLFKISNLRYLVIGFSGIYIIYLVKYLNFTAIKKLTSSILLLIKSRLSFLYILVLLCIIYSIIIYFPTNYDTNVYHFPRIIMWLQQGTLNHFATPVFRMVYQPYLSEIIFAYIYSTLGPVSIVRIWSLIMLILCTIGFKHLLNHFSFKYQISWRSTVLVFTLCGSILLQVTTSLNDIQLLFLLIMGNVFYFRNKYNERYLMILSMVLGYLTKGTFSIFFLLNAVYLLSYEIRNHFKSKKFLASPRLNITWGLFRKYSAISLIMSVLLIPTIGRNIKTTDTLLGVNAYESSKYFNDRFGLDVGISNFIKNTVLQGVTPFKEINNWWFDFVINIHDFLGLPSIHDPGLNWLGFKYDLGRGLKYFFYPEVYPNLGLFYLSIIIMFFILYQLIFKYSTFPKNKEFLYISGISLSGLFLFSSILKWQPWHVRLLMPVFVIQSYACINYLKRWKSFKVVETIILVYALIILVFNANQPVIQCEYFTANSFTVTSEHLKFKKTWELDNGYSEINRLTGKGKTIGFFVSDNNTPLFPFMWNVKHTKNKYQFDGCFINPTNKYQTDFQGVDFIISTKSDRANVEKKYINRGLKLIFQSPNFLLFECVNSKFIG